MLDLSSRSPLQQKRMLELADMIDELESSAPGTSSTSSWAGKKKKRRKRTRTRTSSLPQTTSWCLGVAWSVLVLDSAGCYVFVPSAVLGSDSRFLFMRQSTVPAWFHRIWQSPVCVCCACLPVFLLAVQIRDVLRSLQLPW